MVVHLPETTKPDHQGVGRRNCHTTRPTIFRLNPDLDPFEGDLLRQLIIQPIEEELDLLTEQVHEAPDDEPEVETHRTESPQESDASIPDRPKRMSAVTLTPTQSTIATVLTSRSGPPCLVRPPGRLVEEVEEAEEVAVEGEEVVAGEADQLNL